MGSDSLYSNLEKFLETAQEAGSNETTGELFKETKKELASLSAPLKISKAQRALLAIGRVEALINELLLLRDELAGQAVDHKASKR